MPSYQPVIAQPSSGGDLITRMSGENVGGSNYVIKRDWRRLMDAEVRREGHVQFFPDVSGDPTLEFLLPDGNPVTLIHGARKPNGKTAVIVGSQQNLYRFYSFEEGGVFEDDVYAAGVYADSSGVWLRIGTGFSTSGHRWEAKEVAGKSVFNNGVDLPVVYDLGWLEVRPIYELRDEGIAFAGTIEEFNGMLVLGDVAEVIDDTTLHNVLTGRLLTSVSQTLTTVTGGAGVFTTADIGKTILFTTGEYAKIVAVPTSPGASATVDRNQSVSSTSAYVATLYGAITDTSLYNRTQFRLLVSNIGDPEDFAGGSLTTGVVATQPYVGLVTRTFSFKPGDVITIPGAGVAGSALEATIVSINGNWDTLTIDTPIVTGVEGVLVQKTNRLSSVSSDFDLQDDGSAIIRVSELQGRLVVLKETAIFVGTFTGVAGDLFQFQKVYGGNSSIYWKWMLGKVNGEKLVYASATRFFSFDLSSLTPREHDKLVLCQNVFYDVANNLNLQDQCWAADNTITREIWFVFPNGSDELTDKAICYDYEFNTCSTIAHAYSAAGIVKKPAAGILTGVGEDWFMLGDDSGRLYQYGLTNLTSGIWTRDLSKYDSIMKSGLIDAGNEFDEKDLRNYLLYFSQYTTPVIVTLYGARNANETPTQLFTRTIPAPTNKNLIPTYYRKNYFQDLITVTNQTTNAAVVRRVFEFAQIDSRSAPRNDST